MNKILNKKFYVVHYTHNMVEIRLKLFVLIKLYYLSLKI